MQSLTTNKHNFSHLCCITLQSLLLHLFLSTQTESKHGDLMKEGSKKINHLSWTIFDSRSTYTLHPLMIEL